MLLFDRQFLTDSHCHLESIDEQSLAQWLDIQEKWGIRHHILGGVHPGIWAKQKLICEQDPRVSRSIGLHPWYVPEDQGIWHSYWQEIRQHINEACAIGEIGLDKLKGPPLPIQCEAFKEQLQLAQTHNKPVILHIVKAHSETLNILRDFPNIKGMVHGYQRSLQQANEYRRRGFILSFGPDTLKPKHHELVSGIDAEGFVLESDSLGNAESIGMHAVRQIAESVSNLRKAPLADIKQQTQQNLEKLFSLT